MSTSPPDKMQSAHEQVGFAGHISAQDFVDAFKLARRGTSRIRIRRGVRWIAAGFGLFMLALSPVAFVNGNLYIALLTVAIGIAPSLLLMFDDLVWKWQLKRQLDSRFRDEESVATIDENGVYLRLGPISSGYEWGAFVGARFDDDHVIFYIDCPKKWIGFCRRMLVHPVEWAKLRSMVDRHLAEI